MKAFVKFSRTMGSKMGFKIVNTEHLTELESESKCLHREISEVTETLKKLMHADNHETKLYQRSDVQELKNQIAALTCYIMELEEKEHFRSWEARGLSRFVELLKADHAEPALFYSSIIGTLVKFLGANQGIFYLVNNKVRENVFLEISASYAHDFSGSQQTKILPGEGLIGQCYLDKKRNYVAGISTQFVTIHSGLGEASPHHILIFPLISNNEVVGIVELASFSKFEEHQLEFVDRLGEQIAHAVYNKKIQEETNALLRISNEQANSLQEQEEELRQNLEELIATQDQLNTQLKEIQSLKHELEIREKVFGLTTILSESDAFGTITYVNEKLCEVSKYPKEELVGQGHNIFRHPDMPAEIFKLMWQTIKAGKTFKGIVKNRAKDGSTYWVDAVIVPVMKEDGSLEKYVGARYHIENEKLAQEMFDAQLMQLGIEGV